MPSDNSLCVFGDSHIGSVKFAVDAGLLPEHRARIRFWGAPGPAFRGLKFHKGRVIPNRTARPIVAKVAGEGPATLGPQDFDQLVIYGARMRIGDFVKKMYDYECETGPVSSAVRRAAVRRWMESVRAYRIARAFVAEGADLVFAPVSLPTAGVIEPGREAQLYHVPDETGLFAEISGIAAEVGREDGVRLAFQPAETVTEHTMTRAEFATENSTAHQDVVHKNAAFAAMMMRRALTRLAA